MSNNRPHCVECNEPLKEWEIKNRKKWGNRCSFCYKQHEMIKRLVKKDKAIEKLNRRYE